MVKKSLHNRTDFNEVVARISQLSEDSEKKWGKMNAAQMLVHCRLILQVATKEIQLPEINFIFRAIGIVAKKEMEIFNNGIPHNMPGFQKVIVNFECDFEEAKKDLLKTLNRYWLVYKNKNLPEDHPLFGKMEEYDWGFLEYKHLNHHLKQFSI